MLIRQVSHTLEGNNIIFTKCFNRMLPRFLSNGLDETPAKRQVRKLRKLRVTKERNPINFFAFWDKSTWNTSENQEVAKKDTSFGDTETGEAIDDSIANVKKVYASMKVELEKDNQKYIPERLQILGSDLAAAHFLLFRNCKVQFRGSDEWKKTEDYNDLPIKYDPKYILEAVDCSGVKLYYEGMLNFENLTRIKWASFRGNSVFDVWCMDRIVSQMPFLEYLDVSDCPKLDERGLEAVYKLINLKKLIITNHQQSDEFELTCLMLEDCNPKLSCQILKPEEIPSKT